jgi:hypothetical protein
MYNGQAESAGKLRQNGGITKNSSGNLIGNTLTDNTAATPSKVVVANAFGKEPWAVAAVELRSSR